MPKIDQGVLIFNEWFESARGLSSVEFKKLFLAMYDYQTKGEAPPSFTPKGETLAKVVFPCLEKRVNGAIYIQRRWSKDPNPASTGEDTQDHIKVPSKVNSPTLHTKEEKSKEKKSISYVRASRGNDEKWKEFFEAAQKCALEKADKL